MPTKIYFDANATVMAAGDTMDTAVYRGPWILRWFRKTAKAVALNGHELTFVKRRVLAYEFQPEAEYREVQDKQKREQEDAATASHCRKCGTASPRMFDHCPKCGSALVKKEMPKPEIPGGRNN